MKANSRIIALAIATISIMTFAGCNSDVNDDIPSAPITSINSYEPESSIKPSVEESSVLSSDNSTVVSKPSTVTSKPTATSSNPIIETSKPSSSSSKPTVSSKPTSSTTTENSNSATLIPHTHTYSDWKVIEKSSCSAYGLKERYCSCGKKEFQSIAKTEHKIVKDSAVDATCTKEGLTEGSHCSVCNRVLVKQTTIKVLDHKEVKDKAIAATCTQNGLTEGSHCSVCNTVLVKQETIKAAHKYEEEIKDAATLIKTCSVCSHSYEEDIPKLIVSIAHTGTSSATINGYGSYSKSYKAIASGGYGTLLYKFETYKNANATSPISNLVRDFSESKTFGISYRGYESTIDGYIIKVTVKDAVGNQASYSYEI